jgi:hypothetical protein
VRKLATFLWFTILLTLIVFVSAQLITRTNLMFLITNNMLFSHPEQLTMNHPSSLPGTSVPQQFWQVGVIGDTSGKNSVGMRTTIRTFIPQNIDDKTTAYFWIGAFLDDKTFIQVGYIVPWYDNTAHWFYSVFTPNGEKGPSNQGESKSAGEANEWHQYSLQSTLGQTEGTWVWAARMDEQILGQFTLNEGDTGGTPPIVMAEQSAFEPHAATNDLGPVQFKPAIETAREPGKFVSSIHAYAKYSLPSTCPPYGISSHAPNDVMLGNGLGCPLDSTMVW